MTKIKICGITSFADIDCINEYKPDYAGFVMFFPKSRRNISAGTAKQLLSRLDKSIKSVAVTVSPTPEQVKLAEDLGFDFIQIHGELYEDTLKSTSIPILRAFNVTDINSFEKYKKCEKIAGYIFDSRTPGSGQTFDWNILKNIHINGKTFILAGGLEPENVARAINLIHPDGVDVSSGVESDGVPGKDKKKIELFVNNVRNAYL